jgi:hypothetical protein
LNDGIISALTPDVTATDIRALFGTLLLMSTAKMDRGTGTKNIIGRASRTCGRVIDFYPCSDRFQ